MQRGQPSYCLGLEYRYSTSLYPTCPQNLVEIIRNSQITIPI
jgi:hypothetical protein